MQTQIKRVAGGVFLADYNGEEYILHSPGKIKSVQKLLVGDIVEFEKQDDDFIITKVYERKNYIPINLLCLKHHILVFVQFLD